MQSYEYATSSSEPVTSQEPSPPSFQRSRSIKSEVELTLKGPLEINGSVKSGGSIDFDGDFVVRDKIDAYGAITINGNVSSE
jgi:cytoskeletal protein CcmA (bactofilin family)